MCMFLQMHKRSTERHTRDYQGWLGERNGWLGTEVAQGISHHVTQSYFWKRLQKDKTNKRNNLCVTALSQVWTMHWLRGCRSHGLSPRQPTQFTREVALPGFLTFAPPHSRMCSAPAPRPSCSSLTKQNSGPLTCFLSAWNPPPRSPYLQISAQISALLTTLFEIPGVSSPSAPLFPCFLTVLATYITYLFCVHISSMKTARCLHRILRT